MASIKKYNGSSFENAAIRKYSTSTDTITTLPADLYADGTNATVGLVGNMSQSGTPTPQNPIQPSETGDRTGNLYNIDAKNTDNGYIDGTQLNKDGTTESWRVCEVTEYIELQPSTTYRLSELGSFNAIAYCIYDANKQYISGKNYSGQSVITIAMPSNGKYLRFSHYKTITKTKLNEGTTPLPYEPYGIKIPISSANTTTPVYLGEVQTTRKIKKLVLAGGDDENWNITNNSKVLYLAVSDFLKEQGRICYCTHYETVNNVSSADNVNDGDCTFNDHLNLLYIKDRNYTSAQGFKDYLAAQYAAGTPVTIWYVLAEPTTGIVNEPLRKIGNYADTVSGITIPTITGKDTFDVQTTLKPSEVSLSYTGWHDSTVKEWDGSQWE